MLTQHESYPQSRDTWIDVFLNPETLILIPSPKSTQENIFYRTRIILSQESHKSTVLSAPARIIEEHKRQTIFLTIS